ncbi:MAG: BatD family protein [bacterium]|nr:BatD family protein [bacterium]
MKSNWEIVFFLLLGINSILADEHLVKIKAEINKQHITIGDQVVYTLIVENHPKVKIDAPIDIYPKLSKFEVKNHRVIGPRRRWGKVIAKYKYTIAAFNTGKYIIPAVTLEYKDMEGKVRYVSSKPISIFVKSVRRKSDKDDIRDIKPPLRIPYSWVFYLILSIPLLFGVLGIFGYHFCKKRKSKDSIFDSTPKRPPEEVAYERLERLGEMDLLKQGKIKEYYIILSEIIRHYLEERYGISVLDKTTNEVFQKMKEINITKKHCLLIRDFLAYCDLVKFAKHKPEEGRIEKDFGIAREIVDLTKPAEEKPLTVGVA